MQHPDVLAFDASSSAVSQQSFRKLVNQWARSTPETIRPDEDSLAFFQIDIDHALVLPPPEAVALLRGRPLEWTESLGRHTPVPVIQIFGVSQRGTSVLVNVFGFFPYLLFECPPELRRHPEAVLRRMDDLLKSAPGARNAPVRAFDVTVVERRPLLYYRGDSAQAFCQVTVAHPRYLSALRFPIENGVSVRSPARPDEAVSIPHSVYEANIPFELRFMADVGLAGCAWIEIPNGRYHLRPCERMSTHCQLEIDVFYEDLIPHKPEGRWQSIPPLRILSFDIECVTEKGRGFPTPENDRVIQIATVVTQHGCPEPIVKVVFTLNSCASIPGATVCWFEHEPDLLQHWRDLVVGVDPDIITGYNCINFDLFYLISRADALKIPGFKQLSRLSASVSRCRDTVLSSRGMGTHENKDINVEGRVQMDMLEVVRRDYKLKSYTLNAVCAHFLKEQKEDVHYSMIGDLHRGNEETRRRVAQYCLKDAHLPVMLMTKLLVLYNYVEMARVTGTPLSFLLTRGQQIKVTSQLLRKCRQLGYALPTVRTVSRSADDREKAYEGATVLEPLKGLYKDPIATLDFASLYPSIMMAHNLCYSTLLVDDAYKLGLVEGKDYVRTPANSCFVKSEKRRGVLPMIVEELITARKRARVEMGSATDEMTKMVLNGRQLALKLSANSVYGYTGAATGGQLPCLEVSTSITAYGRVMIDKTKEEVEKQYNRTNGYPCDAMVIYGDTDSVMVRFGVTDVGEAMKLGREAAELVSKHFVSPIKLEFEKVFCPFLLMNKKRYAGLLYTKPESYDKIDCKGIETVRRDFCLLVQQLVDTVLRKLLIDRDEEGAKEYTKEVISSLLQNKIDMSLLVVSKSLGKEDYASKLAHVELANKLRKRDPGNAPQTGDRVHYVITPGMKGQPQYDRAEDPLYVLENNLTIDTQYYLENIRNPITRIFEGLMENPDSLFAGDHTHRKKVLTSSSGAMSKFVKASLRCLGCRSVIPSGALCAHCQKLKEPTLLIEKVTDLRDKERQYSALWTQCQRCQGSLHQDVLCTSRDCPIFYRRMKIRKDIIDVEAHMERLSLDW